MKVVTRKMRLKPVDANVVLKDKVYEALRAAIDEYSDENIRFHQSIIRLSKCELLSEIAKGLFIHMHAIRPRSLREPDRVAESVVDHLHIIEAMDKRDAGLAEKLVREHTDHLAEHVKEFVNWEH